MQGLLSFITCLKKDESMFWIGITSKLLKSRKNIILRAWCKEMAVNMGRGNILVMFLWFFSFETRR